MCNKPGHEVKNCRLTGEEEAIKTGVDNYNHVTEIGSGCPVERPRDAPDAYGINKWIKDDYLLLGGGRVVPTWSHCA